MNRGETADSGKEHFPGGLQSCRSLRFSKERIKAFGGHKVARMLRNRKQKLSIRLSLIHVQSMPTKAVIAGESQAARVHELENWSASPENFSEGP